MVVRFKTNWTRMATCSSISPLAPRCEGRGVGGQGCWLRMAVIVATITAATSCCAAQERDSPGTTSGKLRSWHDDLTKATAEAQRTRQPILVRFGAEWCGWCKRLDSEIADQAVQKELAQWILVELDIDRSPDVAASFGVESVPALRLLTTTRRVAASRDGFLPA